MKAFYLAALTAFFFGHPIAGQVLTSAKKIEKTMVKVEDGVYACKYETSNGDYARFFREIKKTGGRTDSIEKYAVDSAGWFLVGGYQSPMVQYYHSHPSYVNYPAVNVPYEGALAFCEWLTNEYNNDRERKHAQVQFFIPDTVLWMKAARSGRPAAMFPWNNYYLRDREGRYLCNMRRINEMSIYRDSLDRPVFDHALDEYLAAGLNDRAVYTAEISSFYPNPWGLYNMSGNVAEMTIEKGISKGGSWRSFANEIMIRSFRTYQGPNAETGFRIFMRVIKE